MKLAILGGSFNPIHLGHLAIAEEVHKELDYDKIAIIPAFVSPFKVAKLKQHCSDKSYKKPSDEDRIKMIELAIQNKPYLYCEKYEVEKQGVSYTIYTVNYLYEKYPNLEEPIALIIGDDHAKSFLKWKNADELLQKTRLIIAKRNASEKLKLDFPFTELHNERIKISSTEIRSLCKENKSCQEFLVPNVYNYILENKLYK